MTGLCARFVFTNRTESETDLQFLGFIVFENRIKPDTPSVIEELCQANIRNVMLTGDNMHTAISVARTCGIIRPSDRVCIVHANETGVRMEPAIADMPDSHLENKAGPFCLESKMQLQSVHAKAVLSIMYGCSVYYIVQSKFLIV